MEKKIRNVILIIVFLVIIFVILLFINFVPTWNLDTGNMNYFEGKLVNVYYETEKEAALDVFQHAEEEAEVLTSKLGFDQNPHINIYVYDEQSNMQQKKYGIIGRFLKLDWYIGDNKGTDIILTSPANPGNAHSYDSIVNAVGHELVHAFITTFNKTIQLWLTEGMALYLTNGEPLKDNYPLEYLPSFKQIRTKNPVQFSKIGGYYLAHSYIKYIDENYGWEKVMELIKTEDYESVLGISEKELYHRWIEYMINI